VFGEKDLELVMRIDNAAQNVYNYFQVNDVEEMEYQEKN